MSTLCYAQFSGVLRSVKARQARGGKGGSNELDPVAQACPVGFLALSRGDPGSAVALSAGAEGREPSGQEAP
jgi:hypothetical protein